MTTRELSPSAPIQSLIRELNTSTFAGSLSELDAIKEGRLKISYVNTADNLADIFTKAVIIIVHQKLTNLLLVLHSA